MDNVTGTLDKFHLGVSADGQSCVMVFVDEAQRSINCVANYAEFQTFIASLNRVAEEMARRRQGDSPTDLASEEAQEEDDDIGVGGLPLDTLNVASAAFQMNKDAGYIEGALVGDAGEIVGIRMCPEVACQLTRAMLMSAPAASSC
ncbi:hypothetical protein SAMN02745126_05340 [Enhydrobacter aerosaccus]|uniref:Uncharacterized protein n=2 Tax=Enhydrobacter aerosaccus TaxID=225324 RepID=A0A1T4SZ88_9HYPH|nr:hypothetical protein SAMN02745126_05340 [Enhydrobacter aerosaccus]